MFRVSDWSFWFVPIISELTLFSSNIHEKHFEDEFLVILTYQFLCSYTLCVVQDNRFSLFCLITLAYHFRTSFVCNINPRHTFFIFLSASQHNTSFSAAIYQLPSFFNSAHLSLSLYLHSIFVLFWCFCLGLCS